jgi:carbamoylphosphate synthase small subunit
MLYGEPKHVTTHNDPLRDNKESNLYNEWVGQKKMLGICRGGQLLNCLNGGSMFQDVDNHAIYGTHAALVRATGQVVQVTSTHHQMIRPEYDRAQVLVTANLSTRKENGWQENEVDFVGDDEDTEAVFYNYSQSLCFQPHPEYVGIDHECQQLYFDLIEEYLGE